MGNQKALKAQLAAVRSDVESETEGPATAQTLGQMMKRNKATLAQILPSTMSPERFGRIVLNQVRTNPALRVCEPNSVMSACMIAAQLGLEPGPLGHSYLVPFRDKGIPKAQFIVGYKGYLDLAYRSNKIQMIVTGKICENDEYEHQDVDADGKPRLIHRRSWGDRGKALAYYSVTHYTNGGRRIDLLTADEVEKYRARSKVPNSPAWRDDYDAMALKTVLRRAATFWPLTIEAQTAIASDGAVASSLVENAAEEAAVQNMNDEAIDAEIVDDTETPTDGPETVHYDADDPGRPFEEGS